jgi:hypothetical protein
MDAEAALKHLEPLFEGGCGWLNTKKPDVFNRVMEACHALEGAQDILHDPWEGLNMPPSPGKALLILEQLTSGETLDFHDLIEQSSLAYGHLRGLVLPPEVQAKYICHVCGKTEVKLWRMAASSCVEGYCSKCGMAQAGYPDTIDDAGKNAEGDYGPSDQIYNSDQGANLVPWVINEHGDTWGYTSVPPEGCAWWKGLPTR